MRCCHPMPCVVSSELLLFCCLKHAVPTSCLHLRTNANPPLAQDIDRVKAALARPGSLTGGLNYYRAAIAQGTKWRLEAAER